MIQASDIFERLMLLFKQQGVLPQLPGSAMKLVKVLDSEDASGILIERIVSTDPVLAGSLIRVASSAFYSTSQARVSTIRGAVLRLGIRSVRSIALSLAVQSLLKPQARKSRFDPFRHARHAVFVGFLASHLHARLKATERTPISWTSEEIFSAGVLHDLSAGLISHVAPQVHDRVFMVAYEKKISFDTAFALVFGNSIGDLGSAAAKMWGLPDLFSQAIKMMERPMPGHHEYASLCCLHYADALCHQYGYGAETWDFEVEVAQEVLDRVAPGEDALAEILAIVQRETDSYLVSSQMEAA
jgi:HD-like signal output (HDOD) protein